MNPIIKKNGMTFGIIMAIISILITTYIYLFDLKLFTNWMVGVAGMVISIIIGIAVVAKTKRDMDNAITFKEAFTAYFFTAVVSIVLVLLFNILLFNFIAPEIKEDIKVLQIEFMVETLNRFNAPKEEIAKQVENLQKVSPFEVFELVKGSVWSFIGHAMFGALLALIFRNRSEITFQKE